MGYVPPPNVWEMTDEEFAAWWKHEQRRMVAERFVTDLGWVLLVGTLLMWMRG